VLTGVYPPFTVSYNIDGVAFDWFYYLFEGIYVGAVIMWVIEGKSIVDLSAPRFEMGNEKFGENCAPFSMPHGSRRVSLSRKHPVKLDPE